MAATLLHEWKADDFAANATILDSVGAINLARLSAGNTVDNQVTGPGGLYLVAQNLTPTGGSQVCAYTAENLPNNFEHDRFTTFSGWWKGISTTNSTTYWLATGSTNGQNWIRLADPDWTFRSGGTNTQTIYTQPTTWFDSQWHHLAISHRSNGGSLGGYLRAWLDGVQVFDQSVANNNAGQNGLHVIGHSQVPGNAQSNADFAGLKYFDDAVVMEQSQVDGLFDEGKPQNTLLPAISGSGEVGQDLTSTAGSWSDGTSTYQWQTDQGTATWIDIGGETTNTYTVAAGDVGNFLRCVVTRTNGIGSTEANSNAIEAIPGGAPTVDAAAALDSSLTISATPVVDSAPVDAAAAISALLTISATPVVDAADIVDVASSLSSEVTISATPIVDVADIVDVASSLSSEVTISATPIVDAAGTVDAAAALTSDLTISATPVVGTADTVDAATALASVVSISATPIVGTADTVDAATALDAVVVIGATPVVDAPDYVGGATALAASLAISAVPLVQDPGQVDAAAALDGSMSISATPVVDAANIVDAQAALASTVDQTATPSVADPDYVDVASSLNAAADLSATGQVYDVDVTASVALTCVVTFSAEARVVTPDLGPLWQAASLPTALREGKLLSASRAGFCGQSEREAACSQSDREAMLT